MGSITFTIENPILKSISCPANRMAFKTKYKIYPITAPVITSATISIISPEGESWKVADVTIPEEKIAIDVTNAKKSRT
jgi:hypothetical protein